MPDNAPSNVTNIAGCPLSDVSVALVNRVINIQGTFDGKVLCNHFVMLGMYSLNPIWYKIV